jgi:hypothetical protein
MEYAPKREDFVLRQNKPGQNIRKKDFGHLDTPYGLGYG